jgi:hypothetical protein
MKIKLRIKEKKDYRKWHLWFAWYPVKTEDGYIVWDEDVFKKKYFNYFLGDNSYRLNLKEE